MIRSRVFLLLLVLFASPLFAEVNRDVLLTEDGTLFSVESQPDSTLVLTIQQGEKSVTKPVPTSLLGGKHFQPSLAYDPSTRTLFLFWELQPNRMGSSLLVCSYRNDQWSPTRTIEGGGFQYPRNLRIAVTTATTSGDRTENRFLLHLIWWEENSDGEFARYTSLATRNGVVDQSLPAMNLVDLLGNATVGSPSTASITLDREFLRHPAIFENPSHDSVDVVFADFDATTMHRMTLKPVIQNGVLVPPIGVTKRQIGLPLLPTMDGSLTFLSSSSSESLAVYFAVGDSMSYMLYKNSTWTPVQKLTISEELPLGTGIQALKRLLSTH